MTPDEMLLKAVKERHYNGVRRAFDTKPDVNAADDTGWTSLHHAASHGFDEIVDLLLSHDDIDPTLTTPQGETARDLAFVMCHDGIVQKLDAARPSISHAGRLASRATGIKAPISTMGRQRSFFD